MPAPQATLEVTTIPGSPPARITTVGRRDQTINAALEQLWAAILSGSTEEQIAEILAARDAVLGALALISGRTVVTHSGGNSTVITLPVTASSVDIFVNGSLWPRSNYSHAGVTVTPLVPWPTGTDNVEIFARSSLDVGDLGVNNLPAGSVSAPAIAFALQGNLGLYRIGLSLLGVSVAGVERARFTTTGLNVTGDLTVGNSPVYRRANLLGTVSQSAGVPTGAAIQRGSNANGEFVRFADGTQICTFTGLDMDCAGTAGAIFQTAAPVLWTYPAAFAATPVISGHVPGTSSRWIAGSANVSQAGVRHFAAASSATSFPTAVMAVGRWF
jgi:hypothetical protein